ncbi:MAG TPA: CBS domain-containing protein [Polyangiaceae bacterium]|jgi:CBS domain-containing protein|nr:CBS domain-containing protein [Polyangiaceae bacterium]
MDVKEFVRRVVSTHPRMTARMVSEAMVDEETGAIVVLEEGKLVGIVSERDIVARVVAKGLDPAMVAVSDVMTRDVRTVTESVSVRRALEMMAQGRFRHLPVVDGSGQVVGMLSIRDLVGQRIGELTLKNDDLVAFISTDGPGG